MQPLSGLLRAGLLMALFSIGKCSYLGASRSKLLSFLGGSTDSKSTSKLFSNITKNGGAHFESTNATDSTPTSKFTILGEKVVYSGWRKVIRKEVNMPNDRNVFFDVVTQKAPSVSVFIWDTQSSTATLVQEYHPGVEKLMYGTVAGMFEAHKHSTVLECAKAELEEEAQLSSNTWIPLLGKPTTCIPFEKYSDNQLYPFLVLNCKSVLNPKPVDDEDYIIIHKNISHARLLDMITSGELNIISSFTVMLAIRKLIEMGIPLESK